MDLSTKIDAVLVFCKNLHDDLEEVAPRNIAIIYNAAHTGYRQKLEKICDGFAKDSAMILLNK